MDASAKWWSCTSSGLPNPLGNKLRANCRPEIPSKSVSHSFHCLSWSSLTGSSQPWFPRHKSCKISFAWRVSGGTNPKGSNSELTIERIPCLVMCLSLQTDLNKSSSDWTSHLIPRAHFTGSLSRSRFVCEDSLIWRRFKLCYTWATF